MQDRANTQHPPDKASQNSLDVFTGIEPDHFVCREALTEPLATPLFWDRGFKAVMVTDTCSFRNPNYHQPTDTLETLTWNLLREYAAQLTG